MSTPILFISERMSERSSISSLPARAPAVEPIPPELDQRALLELQLLFQR